jgi:hypothetical protein
MDRFVLTDAQWEKMEPHCLGKRSDPGRTGGDILPKPKELLQRRRPLFRANSGFSASLLEGMLAEPAQGICFANGSTKVGTANKFGWHLCGFEGAWRPPRIAAVLPWD